jgi:triacylglycerol lipase
VLAHGLFGFDEIAVARRRHAYFRGVARRLRKEGYRVINARLPGAASIEVRARALAACVDGAGQRVDILAHSMGGLDARYAIARLGVARRVAALVTIGTPHRGTPMADLTADLLGKLGIARALDLAGFDLEALHALTSARMERFNAEVPDARGVAYRSVVGVVRRTRRANPLLLPGYLWLRERAGDNDGVVPASSQRWGEVMAEIEADHWAQIGWSRHLDAGELYLGLLQELRHLGL